MKNYNPIINNPNLKIMKKLLSSALLLLAICSCNENLGLDADKMVAVMAADVDFNSDLNPLKLGYLELLLSTDEISSMLDAEDVARLEKVRIEQLRKQEALPEFFGEKMLHRTRRLGTKFALENDASTRSSGSVIVTTKCGKEVQGLLREEMSDYEMGYWDGYYDASFPNAVREETSSNMYNCHGYAWCKSDGGITCWINAESGNSNIEKY